MAQPLLSGDQEYVDAVDPQVTKLEVEVRDLKRQLAHAELEARHAKEDVTKTLAKLRHMTLPFLNLLRAVHGEIDALGIMDTGLSSVSAAAPQFDPRWEAWKQKFGPTAPSRVIDALLTHGPLSRTQLRQAAEMGWSTLDAATTRLRNLGLIEKSGDRWNLKQS